MKLFAFAVRDNRVEAFLPVFFCRAKGEALRHFMDAVADEKAPFSKHPGDYSLYQLADYDDTSGLFKSQEPVLLLTGLEAAASVASGS